MENINMLLNYFIIDRINGVSYEPSEIIFNTKIIAYSNRAINKNPFIIDIQKLLKGLSEKRYRLIEKVNKIYIE